MSNILQKLFIMDSILVPEHTVQVWNPPVTTVQSMPFPQGIPASTPSTVGNINNAPSIVSSVIYNVIPYQWVVNVSTPNDFSSCTSVTYIPVDKTWTVTLVPEGAIATNPQWNIFSTGNVTVKVDYFYNNTAFYSYPTDIEISVTTTGYYSYKVQPEYYIYQYNPNKGWNSSARSINTILGDGTVKFTIRVDNTGAVVGLNELYDSLGSNYFEISYGILFKKSTYTVVEQGLLKTAPLFYTANDVFSISRANDDIFYLINDTVFYKSLRASTDELLLDCSLYTAGDAVYNAVLTDDSSIIESTATIETVSIIHAQPKAVAALLAQGTLETTGIISIGEDVYALASIDSISGVAVNQDFGGYPLVKATSALTAIGHSLTGVNASFGAMTAALSSNYLSYTALKASFKSMVGSVSIGEVSIESTYIAGVFEGLSLTGRILTGENTLDTTMYLPSMIALAADRPYAAISGTLASMKGYAGEYQDFGNFAFLPFISSSIVANGFSTELNGADLTLFDSTIEGYGGAITEEEAVNFADFTLSSTGSHLDYGNVNIEFATFTLSSTGIGYGTSSASIGFISSTITSFGGANSELIAPVFTLDSTGSYIPLGGASLDFLTWSVSSTGTLDAIGNATIGFPTFTSIWGSAALPAPFLNLSATGSIVIANSVAYVLNIVTNESTRYTNQIWDHIVVLGNKPYGVMSTGLYLLEGATDNGMAIDTYMTTKETDLGSNMAKSIPTIYLNSDTLTYTTAYMDGVAQTPQASSFTGRKCHLSRGAEARYVKLKISGIKNLQGLEILPELKSRRVK